MGGWKTLDFLPLNRGLILTEATSCSDVCTVRAGIRYGMDGLIGITLSMTP